MSAVVKRTLGNLLLMGLALGIATLLGELGLRVFLPQKTMYPRYVDSPDYPIALPANSKIVHAQGGRWRFEYNTNREGHRGTYLSVSDTDHTTRVVTLGDSFTFGEGVNDDDVYPHVLAELLGSGYSVINGGMSGWGIDSQIKWFFKEGAPYRPLIVTLQFSGNDPSDFYGVTKIEDGQFTFHPNPNIRPSWQMRISRSYLLQKSHIYAGVRGLYVRSIVREEGDTRRDELKPEPRPGEEKYARMLQLFADTLRRQGSMLLFLSVTHGHADESYHYDLNHFPTIRDATTRLDAAGRMRFVELPSAEMRQYPGSPEGHKWSAPHHRLAAHAIAQEIRTIHDPGSGDD